MKLLKILLVPLLLVLLIALKQYEWSLEDEVKKSQQNNITESKKKKVNEEIEDKTIKTKKQEAEKTIKNKDKNKEEKKSKLISEIKLETTTVKVKEPDFEESELSKLDDDSNFIEALNVLNQKKEEKKKVNNQGNFGLNNSLSTSGGAAKEEEPSPTLEPTKEFAFGQPRGYAMLYAMHPKARLVVEKQVKNLLDARIREIYISVLIDGTFGKDFTYLRNIIRRLNNTKDVTLTLALYISNGPTMRNHHSTPIKTEFSNIEPERFREMIKWNDNIRGIYSGLVKEANKIFKFNKSLNPNNTNIIIPMLEDNLMRDSYFVMRELVKKDLFPGTTIIRNPCLGCYHGNDPDRLGGNIEEHSLERFKALTQGDGFTFDGRGFNYPNAKYKGAFTIKQTEAIMNIGLQKGFSYIGLWHPKWQGLLNSSIDIHPDERVYAIPTEDELKYEQKLLREGLSLEFETE